MDNPFEKIAARLDTIEEYLLDLKHSYKPSDGHAQHTIPARKVLNVDQLCEYTGLKKQTVYKLTSGREIPHARRGKRLFFDREAIDAWLLSNQRGTRAEAEQKADEFLTSAIRRAQ